ncbi:hypothetical protein J2Y45_002531 [Dyadobacter sp. BE34]|uniref:Uncharacterized protein n=1 Tax=Dyadobacter fermentans TaxID=94254 RepID=A0ABU1QVI5_9BACT|nr:hypothetical protein [Dyadobacter fermentans]MDR7043080.1 hypothetical protein [Dyadobacter sp. BE242]MDR7197392.1 hypothetical protein [Dyadobacter sp. BE34]MDR7215175.1 hypothetical protein [Dyadobacter sp. BE31]MDR7262710.1 hypothetical protein [Dyadobacter sp. BE32]
MLVEKSLTKAISNAPGHVTTTAILPICDGTKMLTSDFQPIEMGF